MGGSVASAPATVLKVAQIHVDVSLDADSPAEPCAHAPTGRLRRAVRPRLARPIVAQALASQTNRNSRTSNVRVLCSEPLHCTRIGL